MLRARAGRVAYVTSITSGNPGGLHFTSSATYDLPTGLVVTTTDENGKVTTNYYSSDSLRPSYIVEPSGREIHYFYDDSLIADSAGQRHYYINVSTKIDSSGTTINNWTDYYRFYDGRDAVKQVFYDGTTTDPALASWDSQVMRYDNMGRNVLTTNPFHTGGYGGGLHVNPAGGDPVTTTAYDVTGRTTDVYTPTGEGSTTTTTAHVNLSYDTWDSGYDGIQTTVTDAAGRIRRQKIDVLGRLVRLDEPDPTTGSLLNSSGLLSQPTSYEYDILGNLEHISQGDQHRYFGYDSLGRLKLEKQVEQYAPYYTVGDVHGNHYWSRKLNYNSSGQVTDSYDAKGTRTHFVYGDDLNRLTQVQYFVGDSSTAQGTPTMTYTYDQTRNDAQSQPYANAGRLTTIATAQVGSTPSTSTQYDFDSAGRIVAHRQAVGSTTYTFGYAYKLGNMLASETYPSGHVASYEYEYAGKLKSVSQTINGTTTTLANGFTFDSRGGLTAETWGNGATQTRTYNRALQPSQLKLATSSAVIQQYDYAYGTFDAATGNVAVADNTGQIGKITSTLGSGSGTVQWMQGFKYDRLGRLSTVTEYPTTSVGGATNFSQSYTYDRYGNKRQDANTALGLPAVSESDYQNSNNNNRFVSTVAAYDDNGNVTQDFKFHAQTYQYAYDANGRQTSASNGTWTEAQVYGCSGQRVQTSVDGVTRTMVYDIFGQNVADYSYVGSGLERENFYRAGQLLATQEFPTTQNVIWTNLVRVTATGNSLYKTAANNWDGGATSTQAIVSGDGYAEFTADLLDYGMYGLSHGNSGEHFSDIDYAIYTERAEGKVYVYEGGTGLGQKATWTSGDRFRVAIEGGYVKYSKNGTVFYSHTVTPTYPLLVDTSLYSSGNTLSNVVISGDFAGAGLRYALQDIQGTTRAVLSASGTVAARHDYLPFGEEIGGGIGSRSALSEYGWTDGNRWNYGMTERDQKSRLDHTLFRKYEGFSGRWTSPDPYRGSMTIANPQSFNRYSYTQNDPVNLVDPTGLAWCFDDQTHKWVECDNVIVDRWEPRSLFNSYFLDAWKSGHSIEIIRLLEGMDPSSTVVPEKPIPGETLRSIQAKTNACLNAALGRYLGKEARTLAKLAAANAAMGLAVGGALVFGAEGLAAVEGATIIDIGIDGLFRVEAVGRAAVSGTSAVYVAGKYWTSLIKESFGNKRDYLRDIERCHSDGPPG